MSWRPRGRRRGQLQGSISRRPIGSHPLTQVQDHLMGGIPSVASVRSFMLGNVNLLHVVGVARRSTLVGIAGRVCGFVSIEAKRATSELVVPFSFPARCKPYTLSLAVTRRISWGGWSFVDRGSSYQFFNLVGYCSVGIICIFCLCFEVYL